MSQAHKLDDKIYDIDLSTMDAKTVGEVQYASFVPLFGYDTFRGSQNTMVQPWLD